jgi:hypothetical protein
MRVKIIISLVALLLLAAAPAWPVELAPTTKNLVRTLESHGYRYKGMKGNQAIFKTRQSVVTIYLNKNGVIYAGGISIGPQAETETTVLALYTIYATLEVNKGRTQVLNERVALKKMSRLIDKVESAVKVSSRTQFRFEDMEVLAKRNNRTDYISIGLQPH